MVEKRTRTHSEPEGRRRQRAAYACRICRGRKVKCNISDTGPPCGYCRRDGLTCEVAESRGYRAMAWNHRSQVSSQDAIQEVDRQVAEKEPGSAEESGQRQSSDSSPSQDPMCVVDSRIYRDDRDPQDVPETAISDSNPGFHSNIWVAPVERSESGIATAASLHETHNGDEMVPVYIGDCRGLGFMTESSGTIDLGHGSNETHCFVPRPSAGTPLQEDLDFLRAKGVFQLPDPSVLAAILRCYFTFVYPLLPIINPTEFLRQYESEGPPKTSLLLLWSMMFAATNFLDDTVLVSAGYESRKAIRLSMYAKAKVLYDTDFEKSKVAIIQSAILLSFWNASVEDRAGPWHWNGVAISLCQSLGIHRAVQSNRVSGRLFTQNECRLWSIIWWGCYSREAWLSLILGRPMRINTADCDMPVPSVADVEGLFISLPDEMLHKYFPGCITSLLPIWEKWLKLTLFLGDILSTCYRLNVTRFPLHEAEAKEDQIREVHTMSPDASVDRIILLYQHQIELSLEAVIITLYRPYILDTDVTRQPETSFRSIALKKSRIAASNSSTALNKLIGADMISICQTCTLAALIVIMQSHLIEFASPTSLHRMVAQSQFDLCMAVLEEMQKTYWAANFPIRFFFAAQQKLQSPRLQADTRPLESEQLSIAQKASTSGPDQTESISQETVFEELTPLCLTSLTVSNLNSSESTNDVFDFSEYLSLANFEGLWG